jgi:signal transduction histidine kinase
VLAACSTVSLVAWRFPLGVFAVTAAAGVLLAGLGYRVDLLLGPAAALYLLAASRTPQAPWTRRATVTVVGLLLAYLGAAAAARAAFPAGELYHTGLAWAVAWFAGERTRLRREQLAELKERALRAEREAERERLLAAATERARIARDLHDSAGHAISVIAVRAGAARLRHQQDPGRALPALEAIEELARQTVGELDQLVGALRGGGSANGAVEVPGLASLDTLIARHVAAGLTVTVDIRGRAAAAWRRRRSGRLPDLAGGARQCGPPRSGQRPDRARVRRRCRPGQRHQPGARGRRGRSGGGHGLAGMRERATLLGGDLDVEHPNGAFRIRARIPYGGHRAWGGC